MFRLIITGLAIFAVYIITIALGIFDATYTMPGTQTAISYGHTLIGIVAFMCSTLKGS